MIVASGPITRRGAVTSITIRGKTGIQKVTPVLLDPGSSRTYVLSQVLMRSGAVKTGMLETAHTLAGQQAFDEHQIQIIWGQIGTFPIRVLGVPSIPDRMEALIGRDVLDRFQFVYGGSANWRWELRQTSGTQV